MQLSEVGYFSRTHGIKGALVLKCTSDFLIDDTETIFVEDSGSKMPCFITEVREAGQNIIMSLEGFDTVEKAKKLSGKKVWVQSDLVVETGGGHPWLGFEVYDEQHGLIGTIKEVSDNGAQLLATINYKGTDVMLPFAEELILGVDEAARKIRYNAPPGLIELYLNEE